MGAVNLLPSGLAQDQVTGEIRKPRADDFWTDYGETTRSIYWTPEELAAINNPNWNPLVQRDPWSIPNAEDIQWLDRNDPTITQDYQRYKPWFDEDGITEAQFRSDPAKYAGMALQKRPADSSFGGLLSQVLSSPATWMFAAPFMPGLTSYLGEMAGGLAGGAEAAAAGIAGGGAAEIASLANLPGFGGVGELAATAAGAGGTAGVLDFLNPQFTLDAAGNVTTATDLFGNATAGANISNSVLSNNAGWMINNAGQVVNAAAGAVPWADFGLNLGPIAQSGNLLSNLFDKVKGIPGGESALSKIMSGSGTAADWARIAGTAGSTLLGVLGSQAQSNAIKDVADRNRAERAPALSAFNNALANPDTFYQSAPAQGAVDAVLRKLSAGGNPALNPGALSQASAYNLGQYNDYLKTMGNLGLSGQDTSARLNLAAAQGVGNTFNALGSGLNDILNPKKDYTQQFLDLYGKTKGLV